MAEWQQIETAPENTDILTWSSYNTDEPFSVDRFRWLEEIVEEVQSEKCNSEGRRRIIQERTVRSREWSRAWGATHWMPLPKPPADP
jgi:hypothetical protein